MNAPDLSLNEWVVLALLAERSTHGFALAKELQAGADLGRIVTVHRPLVYRALDRLASAGLAEPHQTEPSDAGPKRTLHRITRRGRRALHQWLSQPVEHIRDLRIELVVKVRLTERADLDPAPLVMSQRAALAQTLDNLTGADPPTDVVDLWRYHNALAARSFLAALAVRVSGPDRTSRYRARQGGTMQHPGA
jgi:PadR family transcriptional regulator AphA